MLEMVLTFIVWLVSFLLVGFFAGSETALVRLDNLTVRQLLDQRVAGADGIDRMLRDRQCLLSVILIGTNLAVVLSTVLATVLLKDVSFGRLSGANLAAGSMVVLILIFGEILPKRVAHNNAVAWSLKIARPLEKFFTASRPLALLLVQIPRLMGRRMAAVDRSDVDEDSILTMVDMSEEGGGVLETERNMIVGVLESNHTQVKDVMTPRVDMETVAADDGLAEVLQTVAESGFSRIPVYEDTIDNVIGILYLKDLLQHWRVHEQLNVRAIMRPAYFVPQTKNAGELMRELKRLHTHVAIVVDEYGGTAGLVTIEDLLEEIVGEIQDEYDWDEEAEVVELGEGTWLVDARLPIDEVSELVGEDLPDDEVDTIGGLAYLESGRIPATGEEIPLPQYGLHLTVAETDRHRITKLRINKAKEQLQGA